MRVYQIFWFFSSFTYKALFAIMAFMQSKPEFAPLTLDEIHDASKQRIDTIAKEFSNGFEFIEGHPRSVTFFGSARLPEDSAYYKKAQGLAERIVKELGYSVLSGGGPGIMEASNRGAKDAGGHSLGLTIQLPHGQVTNPFVTDSIDFKYFFSRKVCLSFAAEAYLFFPGGFGTMDEFFEILTLVQTHKIEPVPIILVGKDFWRPLHDFIINTLLSKGTISPEDIGLYRLTDDEDEILRTIAEAPVRNGLRHGE